MALKWQTPRGRPLLNNENYLAFLFPFHSDHFLLYLFAVFASPYSFPFRSRVLYTHTLAFTRMYVHVLCILSAQAFAQALAGRL